MKKILSNINKFSSKLSIFVVALISVAIVAVGYGSTFAILSTQTAEIDNSFEVGSVDSEIYENTEKYGTKVVNVVNTGRLPALIRVRVEAEPSDIVTITEVSGENWGTKQEDGYYYYQVPVDATMKKPYEATKSLTIKYKANGVDDKGNVIDPLKAGDFSIVVSQESIQSECVDKDGNVITDPMTIWGVYEAADKDHE